MHESHHARQVADDTTYLIVGKGDEPLGSGVVQWGGCVGSNAREAFPQAVEINRIQGLDEYRWQGVGSALISAAEQLIGRQGWRQTAVGVADDNPKAKRLYLRLGYRSTGVFDASAYEWVTDGGTPRRPAPNAASGCERWSRL